jgi:threonine/homoserine/homoserine lactone efflux protein
MLLLFLIVSVISFAGSIHPGTVNLAVVQTTLSQSRRAGLWLALGGSLPEIGYSALAAGGLMLIPMHSNWTVVLAYAPIPILLGAGIAAFRHKPLVLNVTATNGVSLPFWKGIALGGTNPQLLPFWSAVWLYLSQATIGNQMLIPAGQFASQWVFALGTATGAFGLLVLVVWLADWQRQRIVHYLNGPWINRLAGGLFIGMALWQLSRAL